MKKRAISSAALGLQMNVSTLFDEWLIDLYEMETKNTMQHDWYKARYHLAFNDTKTGKTGLNSTRTHLTQNYYCAKKITSIELRISWILLEYERTDNLNHQFYHWNTNPLVGHKRKYFFGYFMWMRTENNTFFYAS